MIPAERLRTLLDAFPTKRLLVLGDVMLDEYVRGGVARISPEAPVPVVEVQREEAFPGGAANVARNIRALDASVSLLGRIGRDSGGLRLTELLSAQSVDTSGLFPSDLAPTIVKTRVIARSQQVVRVDRERRVPLDATELATVRRLLDSLLPAADAVILEDYAKGFVTQPLVDLLRDSCSAHHKPWAVDPNPNNPLDWTGAALVKPNRLEAFAAAHRVPSDHPDDLHAVGRALLAAWRVPAVLVTLGEHGMALFRENEPPFLSPTKAREVFDVSGAGDTVIAAFMLARISGASLVEATEIANHAAGVVVAKLGTATASRDEVLHSFNGA